MSNLLIENPSVIPVKKPEVSPAAKASPSTAGATKSPWKWLAMTCLLLSISGGFRFWSDWNYRNRSHESEACPFHLSELPSVMGEWRQVEGSVTQLDPETARIAGASDHETREYTNSVTGEKVSVLVVYGLANSIFGHQPEVCYPAAGYTRLNKLEDHDFSLPGSATPVRYRSASFGKTVAGISHSEEVIWSFWHAGSWLPEVESRWKLFRSSPGMFKIQIQYPATKNSSDVAKGASLLKELVKAINSRLEQIESAKASVSKHKHTMR